MKTFRLQVQINGEQIDLGSHEVPDDTDPKEWLDNLAFTLENAPIENTIDISTTWYEI